MKHKLFKILTLLLAITIVSTSGIVVSAASWNDTMSVDEKIMNELSQLSLEEIHNILYESEEFGTVTINRNKDGKIISREIIYTPEEAIIYRMLMDIYVPRMTYAYEYLNRNSGLDYIIGLPFYDYEIIDDEFYIIVEKKNIMSMAAITADKEEYYDAVKLNDGRQAFKAIEKVEDPEAVNLRLNLLKKNWEERVVEIEKILGKGYFLTN